MRFAISVLVLFVWLALTLILWSGIPAMFIDVPTLISVLFVNGVVIAMTGQFKVFIRAKNAILSSKYVISHEDKEKAIELFRLLSKVTVYATVMFTFISLSIMLSQLDDWRNTLGPMLSISMLSIIYGSVFVILYQPAIYILEHRKNTDEKEKVVINEKMVINKIMELCYKQGITPEEVLDANEIQFRKGND